MRLVSRHAIGRPEGEQTTPRIKGTLNMSNLRHTAENVIGIVTRYNHQALVGQDAMKLALAYLEEHPADDDEPVTEDWLRTICEYEPSEDGGGLMITDEMMNLAINFVGSSDPNIWSAQIGEQGDCWPHDLHTRGCVRRLCKALGIPLKEST